MFGLIRAVELFILAQATVQTLPAVDKLHEALNSEAAKRGGALRMELSGCMKDKSRLSNTVVCYYTLGKNVPIEARADQPKGMLTSIKVELPGNKESAARIVRIAGALAVSLIPTLSKDSMTKLMDGIENNFDSIFPGGSQRLESLEFVYDTNDKNTILQIYPRPEG